MSWRDHLRPGLAALSPYRPCGAGAGGRALVRLDANESPFPPEPDELEDFRAALDAVALERYPDPSGAPLREAFARLYGVDPGQILLGNGSDELIATLVTAFAGAAVPKVLFPAPTFGEYAAIAVARGAVPLAVPLGPAFELDEPLVASVMRRERPGLAFFASPNNPTGNRFDRAALGRLAAVLDAALVVDEAYADFDGETCLDLVGRAPGLFVLRSLSKIGLAGLRIGALVASREAVLELDKVRRPFNVSAPSMALACAALARPDRLARRIRRIAASRAALAAALSRVPGLVVVPSAANFVLVRVPGAARLHARLLARGIVVRRFSEPPLADCLRITAGTELENRAVVEALAEALAGDERRAA